MANDSRIVSFTAPGAVAADLATERGKVVCFSGNDIVPFNAVLEPAGILMTLPEKDGDDVRVQTHGPCNCKVDFTGGPGPVALGCILDGADPADGALVAVAGDSATHRQLGNSVYRDSSGTGTGRTYAGASDAMVELNGIIKFG